MGDGDDETLKAELAIVYDDLRKALLSNKYYAQRLARVKTMSLLVEALLAISASSSFASLKLDRLAPAMPYLSAAVAIIAIIKPLLGLDKRIETLSGLTANYADLFQRLKRLVERIGIDRTISEEARNRLRGIQNEMDGLTKSEDMTPSRRRLLKLTNEVEAEIPVSRLWWPRTSHVAEPADAREP